MLVGEAKVQTALLYSMRAVQAHFNNRSQFWVFWDQRDCDLGLEMETFEQDSNLIQGTRIENSWIAPEVPSSSSLRGQDCIFHQFYLCHQIFLRACPQCDTFLDRKFIQITMWVVRKTFSYLQLLFTFADCLAVYINMCTNIFCMSMFTWRHVFVAHICKCFETKYLYACLCIRDYVYLLLCCVQLYMQQFITCWNKRSIPKLGTNQKLLKSHSIPPVSSTLAVASPMRMFWQSQDDQQVQHCSYPHQVDFNAQKDGPKGWY